MKVRGTIPDLSTRLRTHVDVLAELIGERNTAHPGGLDATRAYIRGELTKQGHTVTDQPFAAHNRAALTLEVVLPGTSPKLGTLVIGAHYDSALGTPGADDNASAVAMLLEISRALSTRPPRRTVRIVFYDCEEAPHFNFNEMGSQHHAAQLKRSGERVMGMICLESVGFFTKTSDGFALTPWLLRWVNRLFGQRHIVVVSNLPSMVFGLRFGLRFATSGLFPFLPAALPVKWVPDIQLSDHRG